MKDNLISSFLFGFYYTTKMKYDIICYEKQVKLYKEEVTYE